MQQPHRDSVIIVAALLEFLIFNLRRQLVSVSNELLDVVNEDDEVIAVRRRGEIHAERLMHRAVHILLFNSRDELFLQKRSLSKDEQPGKWDSSAAGHVDSGEDYLACAQRELAEELGIVVDRPLQPLFKLPAMMRTGNEHCMVYRYCFDGSLLLQADEIDEGAWIDPESMDRRVQDEDPDLTDAILLIWKRYRNIF